MQRRLQTPFRFSSRQSAMPPSPHRHRHRGDRLQKILISEKFRHRERQSCRARVTGMPAHLHRKITREIKRSRSVLLMK